MSTTEPRLGLISPAPGVTPGGTGPTSYADQVSSNFPVIGTAIGFSILAFGADPTGAADSSGAFVAAFALIGSADAVLHLPGNPSGVAATYRISNDVVVPANVVLEFESAKLSIDSGKTFTIDGALVASQIKIFSGSGSVLFGAGSSPIVSPLWWGADPTGVADSAPALNAAIESLPDTGGEVRFPRGTFAINSYTATGTGGNCIISGAGPSTILVFANGAGSGLVIQGDYVTLQDFAVQSSSTTNAPIFLHGTSGNPCYSIRLNRLQFTSNPGGAIGSDDWLVDVKFYDCIFTSSASSTQPIVVNIAGNDSAVITFEKCNFGGNYNAAAGICVQALVDLDIHFLGNIFESSGWAVYYLGGQVFEFRGNYTEETIPGAIYLGQGGPYGCGSVLIDGNMIEKGVAGSPTSGFIIFNAGAASLTISNNAFSSWVGGEDFLLFYYYTPQAAIRMFGNSMPTGDALFYEQFQQDGDQVFGSLDSYTNLVLDSDFGSDTDYGASSGGTATHEIASPGYDGAYCQEILFAMSATDNVYLTNTELSVAEGDSFFISFYAKASAPCFGAVSLGGSGTLGKWAFNPTTTWKRFVFQTSPSPAMYATDRLTFFPPVGGAAVDLFIDCIQIERNSRRPHPYAATTTGPVTVPNSNSAAT